MESEIAVLWSRELYLNFIGYNQEANENRQQQVYRMANSRMIFIGMNNILLSKLLSQPILFTVI